MNVADRQSRTSHHWLSIQMTTAKQGRRQLRPSTVTTSRAVDKWPARRGAGIPRLGQPGVLDSYNIKSAFFTLHIYVCQYCSLWKHYFDHWMVSVRRAPGFPRIRLFYPSTTKDLTQNYSLVLWITSPWVDNFNCSYTCEHHRRWWQEKSSVFTWMQAKNVRDSIHVTFYRGAQKKNCC